MDFETYEKRMICRDSLRKYSASEHLMGYEFDCMYPSFRGTVISTIQVLSVLLDGEEVNPDRIRFGVNGKWFTLEEMKEGTKEYWFTGQKATVRVMDDRITEGSHNVQVVMFHKIPYGAYFGDYQILKAVNEVNMILKD